MTASSFLSSVAALVLGAAHALNAQAPGAAAPDTALTAPLVAALRAHAYPVQLTRSTIGGAGADTLLAAARGSRFVLVGEDHGIAEMPQLVGALYDSLRSSGFDHLIVETSPMMAATLERMGRTSDPRAAYLALSRAHAFAVPFFNWDEEARLLEHVVRTTRGPDALWGLDQEFMAAPTVQLADVARRSTNPHVRTAFAAAARRSAADDDSVVARRSPRAFYMSSATPATWDSLAAAARGDSAATTLASELRESAAIYALGFAGDGLESNARRARLMKAHLGAYLDRADARGEHPRVLAKMGAYHLARGRNATGILDVGTTLTELAALHRERVTNLFVLPLAGSQNRFLPFVGDSAARHSPIDAAHAYFGDASVFRSVAQDGPVLVDMRPLRELAFTHRLQRLPSGVEPLVWGYDFVLVLPMVHASTRIADLP